MFRKICNKNVVLHPFCYKQFSSNSRRLQNHYDTLNLPRDCTNSEIRNSYLKLSKEYHPDRNKNKNTHKKFLEISNAYNILSKPSSRFDYDLGLSNLNYKNDDYIIKTDRPGVWTDGSFYEFRDKSQDNFYESKPYYGMKGVKRVSNTAIVLLCMAFTTLGILFQILAIRRQFTLSREEMEKQSADLEHLHANIRKTALENGNEAQLQLLIDKLRTNDK